MVSRSIDLAKNASIDMMTLNNKVVKMRQVVKQTKVHVISKLCKHINKLKNKKGTDEQKAKNLRKAQRLIDEIDFMKKLKEDKVSKYALANTETFNDTIKVSLSPGPRALARLADHSLMKKVVTEFREQHNDWQDLAAYLLIKQTGRRFKTKKQKQKTLSKCVENIEASETMTKAYIKERFGQDGLTKAEQRFERKRKRSKSTVISGSSCTLDSDIKRQKLSESGERNEEDLVHSKLEKCENDETILKNDENTNLDEGREITAVNKEKVENIVKHESKEGRKRTISCNVSDGSKENEAEVKSLSHSVNVKRNTILQQHDESEDSTSDGSENDNTEDHDSKADTHVISKNHIPDVEQSPVKNSDSKGRELKGECVVKLKHGGTDSNDSDGESESNSSEEDVQSISESESNSSEEDVQSISESNSSVEDVQSISSGDKSLDGDDDDEGTLSRKCEKRKKKSVQEILTKGNKEDWLSHFFVEGGVGVVEDNVNNETYNSGNISGDEFDTDRHTAKFLFSKSHSEDTYAGSSKWSQRGTERRGGFERRGPPGKFDKGQTGRAFTYDGQGSRAGFVDAGSVWKFTPQENYNKRGSKNTTKQSFAADRYNRKNVAELEENHQSHTGSTSDKILKEKLHPSWEASKKRKAEQSNIKAFKGTKITFDDDD